MCLVDKCQPKLPQLNNSNLWGAFWVRNTKHILGNSSARSLRNPSGMGTYCVHCTIGYNDFSNLVLSGRFWWLQNLILRHIYKKKFSGFAQLFGLCLPSKFVKKVLIWAKKLQYGIWCWFRFCWKSFKDIIQQNLSTRNWQKNVVFDFYYCMQKFSFRPIPFWG